MNTKAPDVLFRLFQSVGIPSGNDNIGTTGGEFEGQCLADSGGTTRDEYGFTFQCQCLIKSQI